MTSGGKTGSKKRGLSIGAAMKQRMDAQEGGAAPEREGVITHQGPALAGATASAPPSEAAEAEALESFNTRLPRGLHRRLKVHTALSGSKIQDVVAQALDEYLTRSDKKES